MPLRDHFTDKVPKRFHWEGFHSAWPATLVRHLNRGLLPPGYHAEPRVRLGSLAQIDVGAHDISSETTSSHSSGFDHGAAVYAPPAPALILETDLSQEDLFEVQVFDDEMGGKLVAAIELISPGNKDRAQSRHEFVVKCASMLKAQVSLVLIDIVTNRHANLFTELMEYLEIPEPAGRLPGHLYGCSLLPQGVNGHAKVKVWPEVLEVGRLLPTLPLWLRDDLAVPLELESTYEETCGDLGA
jgi:hypothetical protein